MATRPVCPPLPEIHGPDTEFARLEFNGVAAVPLGPAGGAATPFARTMIEASVCLANEMVGGTDRLREDALAYATMRMQFGKPIASFQSMKHKHADMLLEVGLAKSAAYYAAASLDDGDDDAVAASRPRARWCGSGRVQPNR
jgi:alkylation response protein AidB-like acyl-CoA dehydrogenase